MLFCNFCCLISKSRCVHFFIFLVSPSLGNVDLKNKIYYEYTFPLFSLPPKRYLGVMESILEYKLLPFKFNQKNDESLTFFPYNLKSKFLFQMVYNSD